MTDALYIVGVGSTPTGRFADVPLRAMARQAIDLALVDAGATADQVGAAFFANVGQSLLQGQHMIGGQVALREAGLDGIPIVNVENACASASTAFYLACAHLRAGLCDVALAVGAEKLSHPDKARTFSIFDGAHDAERPEALLRFLAQQAGEAPAQAADAQQRSVFMDIYAALARAHMARHGTTQRQLAHVAAKNHSHSVLNPLAQHRVAMSVDEVLAARAITWPLTLPMCAPIGDGAAAALIVREDALARFGFDAKRAVRVRASVLVSGSDRADGRETPISRRAALRAYADAGVGPEDIDVSEVHDATAFGEIAQCEHLGFCEPGQGGWLAEHGHTTLGGRQPVNPSGGLESKGHPIGATGLMQIHELVLQLRGEAGGRQVADARLALAENGGGFLGHEEAAATLTILEQAARRA
ncbi:thiolase family protein [Acidovorax cavernicola]|uniref:Thiolase family protein n=1 Tax=Acidovorax cavernicola TaxID=1675792 RepID=A0A9X8GWF9_9BURK|nr:thiolase family protein [Acidovorax cavernicola]RIX82057.1 thiolase family protein [Acidovorax cavernicola]